MENRKEQKFIQGFNHGYGIAKLEPELATTLVEGIKSTGVYERGFRSGYLRLVKDRKQERLDDLNSLRKNDNRKSLGRDRH